MRRLLVFISAVIYLSACVRIPVAQTVPLDATPTIIQSQALVLDTFLTPTTAPTGRSTLSPQSTSPTNPIISTAFPNCKLDPVSQPPWPVEGLLPNELDPETGLHMTGMPQYIEIDTYRLEVTGLVDHPLSLTYNDLRCMPSVTERPVLECPGVFTDYASWTGVQIKVILDLAGVQPDATQITMVSGDEYTINLPLDKAMDEKNFLAYQVDEQTLPVLHGFPLRAVLPGMWGSYWLKWLVEIRVS